MGSKKTLEQKLALAQDRLSKLKKEASQKERKARDHKKFIAGGEVTRVFGLDYDEAVLLGFLAVYDKLSEDQKRQIKIDGERLLKSRLENADKWQISNLTLGSVEQARTRQRRGLCVSLHRSPALWYV